MATAYERFLAEPNPRLLADDATLHYVTTMTSVSGSANILKHLLNLQKQVRKKKQHVLSLLQSDDTLVLEVDTALEFQTSGGAYLPGLDDNFLTDRTAYLHIIHIVTLDDKGCILQIRQHWDQGALLKQLDIIGKTGRNWPIKDSRDQLTAVTSCLKLVGSGPSSGLQAHNDAITRTRGTSSNALRDPHASLQLFGPREELEAAETSAVVPPYAGNRPRQRSFTEVLGDQPQADNDGQPSTRPRSISPSKAGQGKNHQPMRIFEGQEYAGSDSEQDDTPKHRGPNAYIRPNPRKYAHFDFADGSEPQDRPRPGIPLDHRPKSKNDSQWSFDDFVTPQKLKPTKSIRPQDTRTWDPEPAKKENVAAPAKSRRDADTHFQLQDDGPVPRQERPTPRSRSHVHNDGHGTYKSHHFSSDDASASDSANRALGNITNLKDRGKDFDAHFTMADESPAKEPPRPQQVPENRLKAVKMMDANWSVYDQSPPAQKENQPRADRAPTDSRIHIAGDGMGSKKGSNRHWLYGDPEA